LVPSHYCLSQFSPSVVHLGLANASSDELMELIENKCARYIAGMHSQTTSVLSFSDENSGIFYKLVYFVSILVENLLSVTCRQHMEEELETRLMNLFTNYVTLPEMVS
jgi:hypothetical protein